MTTKTREEVGNITTAVHTETLKWCFLSSPHAAAKTIYIFKWRKALL